MHRSNDTSSKLSKRQIFTLKRIKGKPSNNFAEAASALTGRASQSLPSQKARINVLRYNFILSIFEGQDERFCY